MSYFKIITILMLVLFGLFLVINIPTPIRIEGDGVFYFSWLRSALFDHDFDFYNELKHFSAYDVGSQWMLETDLKTNIGKIPNAYAYGTGLLWWPLFSVANLLTWIFNLSRDGYSWFYVLSVNLSSWLFGVMSFYIIYLNLKKFFSDRIAFWSSLGIYLATPVVYYQFFEPSMSHLASLFSVCLFFHLVIKIYKQENFNWWWLALTVFIMLAIRWQNLLFLMVLWPSFISSRHNLKLISRRLLFISMPAIFFWLTQMAVWKHLYGQYFLLPQGQGFVRFDFHGLYILLSSNRGLLLWSPIIILAVGGFYFLYQKSKYLFFIAISAFIVQWLINGSLNDLGGGDAYGARRFIETLPFLALALAAFWSKYNRRWLIVGVTVLLISWNLILIENYRQGIIPHSDEFNILKINYIKNIINLD